MSRDKAFTLTEAHVKLLRSMWVGWDDIEYGAPAIDPKRPYGNSAVTNDIHEVLTGEEIGTTHSSRPSLTREEEEAYASLHRETEVALQVVLVTGSFEPGEYRAPPYTIDWRRVA